jgi:site-specific recombinase XerD
MHPIAGDELRLLRRYLRERESELPWLFVSERGSPLARSTVNKLLEQCCDAAALPRINPHMLRHGCGFYMINNGYDIRAVQIYLGHVSISNTAIYARFNEKQFVGMWE